MSSATQKVFAKDSWQTPRNARTLRALMALRNEEIGQRLTELREQRGGPPQEVVAQEVGVSYRSIQAWEAGETKPSWRNLTQLATYYGVSPEFILVGENGTTAAVPDTQLERIEAKLDELLELVRAIERGSLADLGSELRNLTRSTKRSLADQVPDADAGSVPGAGTRDAEDAKTGSDRAPSERRRGSGGRPAG